MAEKSYPGMAEAMGEDDESSPGANIDMPEPDDGGDVPPEIETAYQDYQDNPSAASFMAVFEACMEAGNGGGHGLTIMLGKGKR